MKLIIKDRGMGKTTQLIHISEATGYPIVVAYKTTIGHIKSTAKNLDVIFQSQFPFLIL